MNKRYLDENAETYASSFGDLLPLGRVRKKAEYLQKVQNPELKAQIEIKRENSRLVCCIYKRDCHCKFNTVI